MPPVQLKWGGGALPPPLPCSYPSDLSRGGYLYVEVRCQRTSMGLLFDQSNHTVHKKLALNKYWFVDNATPNS